MKIIDQGIIFSGIEANSDSKCCFSSLTQLSNGEIIANFQAASKKNGIDSHILLARSSDGGRNWGKPYAPFSGEIDGKELAVHVAYLAEIEPGRLMADLLLCDHLGDPDLEFFNPDTGGLLPSRIYLSESTDKGHTWTLPTELGAFLLSNTPLAPTGPIHRIDSDTLICPFETSKPYNDPDPWLHKAAYFVSPDRGRTWPEYKVVAHDPQNKILYWDYRLANFGNGKLISMFWAYDNVHNKELNAHVSSTADGGRTWTVPVDTGLVGQPWPIVIDEHRFVVTAVDRDHSQTIYAVLTEDFGRTWHDAGRVVIYNHREQVAQSEDLNEYLVEMGSWSYGLPSGIKLANGDILLTYYAGDDAATSIHWCLVRTGLLQNGD